jgi:hypothetical protein
MIDNFTSGVYINSHFLVKQTCEVCGKETFTENPLEKCIVCQKSLCSECDHHGFCQKDYEKLSPEEKKKIEEREENFSKKNKWRFLGLFGNTLWLFVGFILMMLSESGSALFIVSTIFIVIPILDMFGIIYFYFKGFNRVMAFKQELFTGHEN